MIEKLARDVSTSAELDSQWSDCYKDLVRACRDALGDVVVEPIGSLTRKTASTFDMDLDFLVRRSNCGQMNEPFTKIDKENVAKNLEKLNCVSGKVTVGNIAIKFIMESAIRPISVDLVLWKPRLEKFPNLRGGEDFYENSKRINNFLEQTPAARAAIVGVKENVMLGRPKGILLEAIAWRLWATFPDKGTCRTDVQSFLFFDYMLACLANWEVSPFGNDLKQDLARLRAKKRKEHRQSFANFRKGYGDPSTFYFILLIEHLAEVAWENSEERIVPPYVYYKSATQQVLDKVLVWRNLQEMKRQKKRQKKRQNERLDELIGPGRSECLDDEFLELLKALIGRIRKGVKQRSKTQRKKVLNPVAWAFKIPLGLRISVDLKDLGL